MRETRTPAETISRSPSYRFCLSIWALLWSYPPRPPSTTGTRRRSRRDRSCGRCRFSELIWHVQSIRVAPEIRLEQLKRIKLANASRSCRSLKRAQLRSMPCRRVKPTLSPTCQHEQQPSHSAFCAYGYGGVTHFESMAQPFNEPGAVEQSVSSNPLTRWRDAQYFACARYVHIALSVYLKPGS
jgi:hypothetical protein